MRSEMVPRITLISSMPDDVSWKTTIPTNRKGIMPVQQQSPNNPL